MLLHLEETLPRVVTQSVASEPEMPVGHAPDLPAEVWSINRDILVEKLCCMFDDCCIKLPYELAESEFVG